MWQSGRIHVECFWQVGNENIYVVANGEIVFLRVYFIWPVNDKPGYVYCLFVYGLFANDVHDVCFLCMLVHAYM